MAIPSHDVHQAQRARADGLHDDHDDTMGR
jgi:hypothetical protein